MDPGVPPTPTRSAAVATTTPTTLLGKYQLGRLLGRGNFAKVYKAQTLTDNTAVAIKIINKSQTDAAMEPRILREIDAMRRLSHHPNILKIHEVLATKSKIYLVVELATGGELLTRLSRHGKFPESLARRYFQQLVSALHFCHQSGVAHRDLKPQNILLDKNGSLKVSDFGLSALPDQIKNGLLHTACGTPAYTAPEVLHRRGYDGAKADAWSCGVILFVLLTGRLPFDDANLAAMYKKVHRREYEIPGWIPRPAGRIIYQLLDPNPDTRLGIEAVMEKPWFKKSLGQFEIGSSDLVGGRLDGRCDVLSAGMNAFDIISMSSGLDLSGIFEAEGRRGRRFTAEAAAETVVERVAEIGKRLGYRVERGKGGVRLGKGAAMKPVMAIEVMEIAPHLVLGEVKMAEGRGVEVDEEVRLWEELKAGLANLVVSWHNVVV